MGSNHERDPFASRRQLALPDRRRMRHDGLRTLLIRDLPLLYQSPENEP